MSYATTFGIDLSVEGGPPRLKQTGKLENVDASSGQRYVLAPSDPNNPQDVEETVVAPDGAELRFCTINADRFAYDDCGAKRAGIILVFGGEEGPIDEPQIYLNRPGQNLESLGNFKVRAKKEMFAAAPNVMVTVTYGIDEP